MKKFFLPLTLFLCQFAYGHTNDYKDGTLAQTMQNGRNTQTTNSNMNQQYSGAMNSDPNVVEHSSMGCMDSGFTFQADFLWWRANMDDLDYGLQLNDTLFLSTRGKIVEPDFNYDPGVRVGAGYDFGRSNWDILFAWTYHYSKATNSSGNPNVPISLIATRGQTYNFGNYKVVIGATGRASWRVHLNSIDFEMGYDHFYSKHFSVRSHFGLKAAWINMEYHASYKDLIDTGDGQPANITNYEKLSLRTKSDFWAVGPRMGLQSFLHIGWGFSIYGKIAGSLVYGEYSTDSDLFIEREQVSFPFTSTTTDVPFSHDNFSRLRAIVEMSIGLEWSYCFSGDYLLSFHLGWENQYWWNQLEARLLTDYQPNGDLTYSGIDAGIRFDF